MKEPKIIPYFNGANKKNIIGKIKSASEKRKVNPLLLIFRKMKNNFLYKMAFHCKSNARRIKMHRWRGVNIGKNVYIAKDCILDNSYPDYIYIEDNVALAGGVVVLTHTNPYIHFEGVVEAAVAPVVIKEGAWIGIRAIVLRGTTVGKKAIVSAGTVVDRNVPDYTIARGNPMKIVTEFKDRLLKE